MNSDDMDRNILSLYNAQKWEEIAALSSACCNSKLSRLSWVLPDMSDLYWINDIIRKYNLLGVASIGCGCGLLEWLLQKCSGLDVVGIELDSSWWSSKYSPPQFLKNIIFVENKSNFQVPKRYAMLFCYFNNCAAFCNYMENYKVTMSTDRDVIESKKDTEGKNKDKIYCTFCPSKMLNAGAARLINMDFALPYIHSKAQDKANQSETISDYWLIEDMYTFENIGVSHTVGNVKYLACADCERGPVGWHDLSTKKSYIALCRVKHE